MRFLSTILILLFLSACDLSAINSPYPEQENNASVLYASFSLRPKHLDPARSYSSNEAIFTGQIYEPPYQYHYLKRPYTLIPLTATELPKVRYFSADNIELAADDADIAYSLYQITIKPEIRYQPHPSFVKETDGQYVYHQMTAKQLVSVNTLSDFKQNASRELVAADYVYQIKRLAHPEIHSPILGLMSEHIVGLADYAEQLRQLKQKGKALNLRTSAIEGVTVIDRYRYQIKVVGKYPQLRYWLAMPFFAPVPWEADIFYAQKGLIEKNITLDWFPVGTGPYQLTENNPNQRMVLERNPNYHDEYYPENGDDGDFEQGLLKDSGQRLPLIDKVIFTLEKENTSYWNKFLQGYYDVSGISSDSFEQAIQLGGGGEFGLSDAMKKKGIDLRTSIGTSSYYIGFNMHDSVVGGYSEKAKKLRQALSIAIDYEEFISIFLNGRGIPAQGVIPPGIFGYIDGQQGINPRVYNWDDTKGVRKNIKEARELLVQAGYPNGRDEQTGEPLNLYFDVPASGPDARAQFDWLRKQFKKLGIQLIVRSSDYNRFQDKMHNGQAQIFQWGWNADYPDPENFLFLLYGPNGKVATGGENAANYENAEFDRLFEQMRAMPNNDERLKIIQEMSAILTEDSPWVWGYHPKQFSLYHAWNKNIKPNLMANNTIKYRRIDAYQRKELQQSWNKPILWPLIVLVFVVLLLFLPAFLLYIQKKYTKIT
ncbi:MAG: ABC transporter substrate-binding protein [Piscirickettsiaceae bacterium]|nr:ABC transporter substrate-binding protein [Piscirickettsiaceae bacterium]